jgi:UDP-N-acetylglucosamine 2-epimerase (non-hydrolysing)
VHTGQHYDRAMNDVFFEELGIPPPDSNLACGGGSHAEQVARIMVLFEAELLAHRPDWIIVVGDVNSTLACSIVASKLGVRIAHVEAGLRSGDRSMPEEINRLVTDSIADLFFVTEPAGCENLRREGHPEASIHFVGHVMIDNLFYQANLLTSTDVSRFTTNAIKRRWIEQFGRYGLATLHRPSNVDEPERLRGILDALRTLTSDLPIIMPVHPRTNRILAELGIKSSERFQFTGPLSYMEFLNLSRDAAVVLTDSGGLQEETTALGVRCVTIRENTERPITLTQGTNVLAGTRPDDIVAAARKSLAEPVVQRRPPLWDGLAAKRIVDVLASFT